VPEIGRTISHWKIGRGVCALHPLVPLDHELFKSMMPAHFIHILRLVATMLRNKWQSLSECYC
jgi:hypothetical protein